MLGMYGVRAPLRLVQGQSKTPAIVSTEQEERRLRFTATNNNYYAMLSGINPIHFNPVYIHSETFNPMTELSVLPLNHSNLERKLTTLLQLAIQGRRHDGAGLPAQFLAIVCQGKIEVRHELDQEGLNLVNPAENQSVLGSFRAEIRTQNASQCRHEGHQKMLPGYRRLQPVYRASPSGASTSPD